MNSTEINTLLKELNNKQNTLTTLVDRRSRAQSEDEAKSIITEFTSIAEDMKSAIERLIALFKQG